jgi:hypothetical protein
VGEERMDDDGFGRREGKKDTPRMKKTHSQWLEKEETAVQ